MATIGKPVTKNLPQGRGRGGSGVVSAILEKAPNIAVGAGLPVTCDTKAELMSVSSGLRSALKRQGREEEFRVTNETRNGVLKVWLIREKEDKG